jgi:hypothetical protein
MQQANTKNLRTEFVNPFVRLLPLRGLQNNVYRMGDAVQPGLEGYQPRWQVLNAVLGAQQTIQLTIDVPHDFYLLAILTSSSSEVSGGFRAQFYDVYKKYRLQDRGVQHANLGGANASGFFLRDAYHFDQPRSQVKVILQNMELVTNTIQVALYGVAAPFSGSDSEQ